MSHSCPNLVSTSFLYNPYIPFFNLQEFFIYYNYSNIIITQYGSTVYIGFITIKPILKENSDLTFSFKLFPFLVTSMSKKHTKRNKIQPK